MIDRIRHGSLRPLIALCLILIPRPCICLGEKALDLGSRREPIVDRYLFDRLDRVSLMLERPRDEGVVLRFDRPWEGAFCAYATVIRDGPLFRLYYRGLPQSGRDGSDTEVTCYAESRDGINWIKPDLDQFAVGGSRANNVVLAGQPPFSHNFSPMIDERPGVPRPERYKALAGTSQTGLVAFVSGDGLRWRKLSDRAVIPRGGLDSQNVAFWSGRDGRYLCFLRVNPGGIRRIARSTSTDFLNWTEPELMSYGDRPVEHLYTNQTSPYFRAPHIDLGIAARFFPGKQVLSADQARAIGVDPDYFRDCSDAVLITSRGGTTYDRTFMEGFLIPGIGPENWVSRTNYPARNLVQTGPNEMSFYVNQNYGQPTSHLRRYSLRLDGFACVRAGYDGGEVLTHPLRFSGRVLRLNFATSAGGEVRVELHDEGGKPIPGFQLAECEPIIGNEIDRVVRWRSGSDLSALSDKAVRLRISLKDASLYALQFGS
ncbi:MAG: hypothetical protein U0790_07490 [Isosphaeraceae bacterium]